MINTIQVKRYYLVPGVNLCCRIPVPDLAADPTQAPGLGDDIDKKSKRLDEFVETYLAGQYKRAMQTAIYSYQRSELPQKFLVGQNVMVCNLRGTEYLGSYSPAEDLIILDADHFSIGMKVPGDFLYGHEVGHRIMYYKPREEKEAIKEVKGILCMTDNELARETLCDTFGYLMSRDTKGFHIDIDDANKLEGLSKVALRMSWK